MPTHTSFHNVSEIGRALLSEQLETNLTSWFNWCFLGIGGFFNVRVPTSGYFGGDMHRLRRVEDPYYQAGQVWQGFRHDWVWETGVEYPQQPIRVSGVYVNSAFYPSSTTGAYKHHVNYPLGRVVFDSPISPTSLVACEYSYRYVQFTTPNVPWWREIQQDSFRVDDSQFGQVGSGAWAMLAQNRIQLPAVVVEVQPNAKRKGLQLGGGDIVSQDVVFHVIAETPWDRNQLHDTITFQWQKRIIAFEKNWMADSGCYPLDENGTPVSGAKMYPDLVKATGEGGFGWQQIRFKEFTGFPVPKEVTAPLYVCKVRGTFEIDMP